MDPASDASYSSNGDEDEEDGTTPSSSQYSTDGGGGDPQPPQPQSQREAAAKERPEDDAEVFSGQYQYVPRRKSRYEDQKRRDWRTFLRWLHTRKPRLTLSRLRSPHVIEFLQSLDPFGKTVVHDPACPFFARSQPPVFPCACPLRQSWGSLDAMVGRLRAVCEDAPARPETNPFGVRAVRNYLLRVKDTQATARGIPYSRNRNKRKEQVSTAAASAAAAIDLPPDAPANVVPEEQGSADAPPASAPPGLVPVLGPAGPDGAAPMQMFWVRPPTADDQSTTQFYPIWTYPTAMESMAPFLPPFPYMPVPTAEMTKEKEPRIPKQEDQTEDYPSTVPLGTREEGPTSSNEGGGSDPQGSGEHPTARSQQKSRYEEQKRRDWNTFSRFMENRQPRLTLSRVRSPHVIEFLKSIDQFGKTQVHKSGCPYFGNPNPAASCDCPLQQSWGSIDALVGRLRAVCEESPNRPETNPFGVRSVRNYLLRVKDIQATARGIPYSRKRKRNVAPSDAEVGDGGESTAVSVAVPAVISYPPMLGEGFGSQVGGFSTYQEDTSTATTGFAVSVSPSSSLVVKGSGDPPVGSSSVS